MTKRRLTELSWERLQLILRTTRKTKQMMQKQQQAPCMVSTWYKDKPTSNVLSMVSFPPREPTLLKFISPFLFY